MKLALSRAKEFVPDWNGNLQLPADQQLKYLLTPVDNGDFYDLQDCIGRLGLKATTDGKVDSTNLDVKAQREFLTGAGTYLTRYVKSTGAPLLDQNDKEITIEDIGKYAALIGLANEILMEIIKNGVPQAADSKN